jgi:uncharacterized protein
MSRIRKAYEAQFRWLLRQARARRLDRGVAHLLQRAEQLSANDGVPLSQALTHLYEDLAGHPFFRRQSAEPAPALFFCDAGLGGLARWLRAAGHDALWEPGIADPELLRRARELSAALLTTDSMLMERRVLRDRLIRSLWIPPTLSIADQLKLVFREFRLVAGSPRCMTCGGRLRPGDKEILKPRIPPRTYRWRDEYFVCERCDKLFWHGTHWLRIRRQLSEMAGRNDGASVQDRHAENG